jgi:multiple sugar transport system ATP-binding protein
MAPVSLRHVRKVFPGGVEAVRGVSLDVADGEFLVLVGPSGCGKSTVLRMIAGLDDPTSGEILIAGRDVTRAAPKDRDVAMVFQNYALYPHMTVRDNMGFALRMRGVPKDRIAARVAEVAASLGLSDVLGRRPGALSGGQRQRVALGRAIVREPRAFLFDEPLSNLDARLRVSTRAELKALHRRLRTTSVYVTHDQEEAMTLGDRLAVLAGGELQQVGTPLDVYRHPANRFVAAFIGSPAMNFIDGTLHAGTGGPTFAFDGSPARIAVDPGHAPHLAPHAGRPVTLGLRPAAVVLSDADHARSLPASITHVETLGESTDVHLAVGGAPRLLARVAGPTAARPGDDVRVTFDMARAHWFEAGDFGRSLLPAGAAPHA